MPDYADWGNLRNVLILLDPGDGTTGPRRLRNVNGAIATIPLEAMMTEVVSGKSNISTLTPILGFRDLSGYSMLTFEGWTDSTDEITFIIEKSPDGVHADVAAQTTVITQGTAGSIDVPSNLGVFWRLSAHTDSPGFPTSVLNWKLRGLLRQL